MPLTMPLSSFSAVSDRQDWNPRRSCGPATQLAPIRLPAATSFDSFLLQGWFPGSGAVPQGDLPGAFPDALSSGLLPWLFAPPPLRGQRRDLTGFPILRPPFRRHLECVHLSLRTGRATANRRHPIPERRQEDGMKTAHRRAILCITNKEIGETSRGRRVFRQRRSCNRC